MTAGPYIVLVQDFGEDVLFAKTNQSVNLPVGGNVGVSFNGETIVVPPPPTRGRITASVQVGSTPLSGVTVTFAGPDYKVLYTGQDGIASADSLLAGRYSVSIDDYGNAEFSSTVKTVDLPEGGDMTVRFEGESPEEPTAKIFGRVFVEGAGYENAQVVLAWSDSTRYTRTDENGDYNLPGLVKGSYTVTLTNPDQSKYEFQSLSQAVDINSVDDFRVDFFGTLKQAPPPAKGTITATVTVDGNPRANVTVYFSGPDYLQMATNQDGVATASNMTAGPYIVLVQDFGEDVLFAKTNQSVNLPVGGNKQVSFSGSAVVVNPPQTDKGTITAVVTVDENPRAGISVRISSPLMNPRSSVTGSNGQAVFSDLPIGEYGINIEGFGSDVTFTQTSQSVSVLVNENVSVNFEGSGVSVEPQPQNQKASIVGKIFEDANGNWQYDAGENVLAGVEVVLSLSGSGVVVSGTETGLNGECSFTGLDAGNYDITVVNPNTSIYAFDSERNGVVTSNVAIGNGDNTEIPLYFIFVRK
jgi:hypothetical protein